MDDKKAVAVALISGFMAITSAIISGIFIYQASVGAVREEARITQQAQETAIASSLTAYAPTGPAAVQERIVIVTVVVTATPDPAAVAQTPNTKNAGLDYVPGITFSPNAYFIFSILVGVLLIIIFIDVLGRHPLSLSWLLYAAILGYYIYHLMAAQSPKSYPYQVVLSVVLLLGLAYMVITFKPYYNLRTRKLQSYAVPIALLLPISLAIVLAGWNQLDLLEYVPYIFPWTMTFYGAFLVFEFV